MGVNAVAWRKVERGCPQVSICGPFIWTFMKDGLLWKLEYCGCKCVAYTDDMLVMFKRERQVEIERE